MTMQILAISARWPLTRDGEVLAVAHNNQDSSDPNQGKDTHVNATFLQRFNSFREASRRRLGRLRRTALAVPAVLATLVGICLLLVRMHYLKELGEWGELVRDLGIAALVSAASVTGFELVRETANIEEERARLQAGIESLQSTTEVYQELGRFRALAAIEDLLNVRARHGLNKPLCQVLTSTMTLVDGRDAAAHHYGEFAKKYLAQVGNGLEQLRKFRDGTSEAPSDELRYSFEAPEPRKVISEILAAELGQLEGSTDSYDSITNPLYYDRNTMRAFGENLITKATERGVKTRRIFNMVNFETGTIPNDKMQLASSKIGRAHV